MDTSRLLKICGKYIAKGIDKGAYKTTVGGNTIPRRILKEIIKQIEMYENEVIGNEYDLQEA